MTADSGGGKRPSAEEDWGEVDAWLAGAGKHTPPAAEEEARSVRRSHWDAESTGRAHDHFFSNTYGTWAELGASDRLEQNLAVLGIERPSTVQKVAFQPIMQRENCLIAASCGTGKTLGYLAPIIQQLWSWEAKEGRTPAGQVRAIIIVPNAELGQQVLERARNLANRSIRASIATGDSNWSTQRKRMQGGLELLVATMGRLTAHLSPRGMEPSMRLDGVRTIVVDEADALYAGAIPGSATWSREVHPDEQRRRVVQEAPLANWKWLRSELPAECSTTLVTCAVPCEVEERMREDIPSLEVHMGRGLHVTRPGVRVRLVDCSVPVWSPARREYSLFGAKLDELIKSMRRVSLHNAYDRLGRDLDEHLDEHPSLASRQTLVLCNTAASCERLVKELTAALKELAEELPEHARGVQPKVIGMHASLPPHRRQSALAAFRKESKEDGDSRTKGAKGELERRSGLPKPDAQRILVTTGRSARGMDLSAGPDRPVEHVVLFDFPPDGKAYIKRVGCATRGATRTAYVTALAVGPQLKFAKALLEHDRDGSAVDVDLDP